LVGLDQAGDRGAGAGQVAFDGLATARGGVFGAQRPQPAVDLGAHERGVLEQAPYLAPDELVELVGADRTAVADAPADVAVVVRADAAVVVDPLVGRARRGAVAGVAALSADEDALQQRRLLGVALGEVRVLLKAGLRERELFLAHERLDGDQRPLLGRLVAPHRPAAVALAPRPGRARRRAPWPPRPHRSLRRASARPRAACG